MVDIVIAADPVLDVHVVVDGGDDILLGHMLGNQLMHTPAQDVAQSLGILALLEADQDLAKGGIVDLLRDAEILGIAVDIVVQVDHEVGKDLDVALLCPDHDIRHSRVLDLVGHLPGDSIPGAAENIPVGLIHNILSQHMAGDPAAHGKLLVEFIAAHLGQIISPGIKEHGVDQAVRALDGKGLTRPDLLVELEQTGFKIVGRVLGEAGAELGLIAEELDDLLIRSDSQCAHQNSDRHLSGPVHTDIKHIVGICLIFQPGAPVGDHRAGKQLLAEFILIDAVVDTGGTNKLADDDTLGAVDHEGSVLGHQRKISHKDLLALDLAVVLLVIQLNKHFQRRRIGAVPFLALLDRILGILLLEPVTGKSQAEMSAVVLDRRNIVQYFLKSLITKPLIGVLLNFDQIRHGQDFLLTLIAHPDILAAACRMYPVFFHLIHPVNL